MFNPDDCIIFNDRTGGIVGINIVKVSDWFKENYTVLNVMPVGAIYVYNDGVYRSEGGSKEWITDKVFKVEEWGKRARGDGTPLLDKKTVSELVSYIQMATYKDMYLDYGTRTTIFDSNINIINMRNGLYNWRTGEFSEHDPEYLSRIQIPVEYIEGATCPTIDAIIKDVLHPDDVVKFYEFCGYLLYRGIIIDKAALMLYGPARSGKSELARLIQNLVGINNCAATTLQELANKQFAIADLEGKLVDLIGDVDDKPIENEGMIKRVTSGKDLLRIEKKFQSAYQMVSTCKIVMIANILPRVSDITKGFFRRMEIFRCDHVFTEQDDPTRLKAIDDPYELAGFFLKCMSYLPGVIERRKLTNETSADMVRSMYNMHANPLQGFIDTCVDDDVANGFATKDMTYKFYVDFCNIIGVEKLSKTQFGRDFKKAMGWTGIERQAQRKYAGGMRWGWTDIKLKKAALMLGVEEE